MVTSSVVLLRDAWQVLHSGDVRIRFLLIPSNCNSIIVDASPAVMVPPLTVH
jgi:hypothetical protein